jgi:predicted lipid-binding transport protein (Tim44 family)
VTKRLRALCLTLAAASVFTLTLAESAEARRGGSFGSRGARTYRAPPPTRTAPEAAKPVERSMTQPQANQPSAARAPGAAQAQAPKRGFLGGGLMQGLVMGGLIGLLLGHGFGGAAGAMGMVLQIGLLLLAGFLLMRLFASRRPAAYAGGPTVAQGPAFGESRRESFGGAPSPAPAAAPSPSQPDEIGLKQSDLDDFERLLEAVQSAFSREDFAALREITTPEIMSYLAEELAQNSTDGVRNDVSAVKLLQADVAEAWTEGDADYATAALRFESRDVMRDRADGRVVRGDPDRATETIEHWTFTRRGRGPWKLSAIQAA